ncbi:MAG: DUF2075 domain-containing protein [Spirochaetales bacterium]|nr:DUF2075 domain-containing protein [Spirochaetales bacterium]
MNINISKFDFKKESIAYLSKKKEFINWPIVYILESEKEAYIGETTSASRRINDHLENPIREVFDRFFIIEHSQFNKSATLDIESKLIEYISSDGKYTLQNNNRGLRNHNYYNKNYYRDLFEKIWDNLLENDIASKSLRDIENSDLFKYSPFKILTDDQAEIVDILEKRIKTEPRSINIVNGEPGSGKTILAIYLIKYLISDEKNKDLKIGIVLPQTSLRQTVSKIFKSVKDLKVNMVLGPNDVVNNDDDFDVLVIDESHRLAQRKNLSSYVMFDNPCKKLGLDPTTSSQLDWVLMKSKHTILLYDEKQSVKPSDVDKKAFDKLKSKAYKHTLTSQLRVLAGNQYSTYIDDIFRQKAINKITFKEYDFLLFDNISELINKIKLFDNEIGLCRIVAGYAWEWKSKLDANEFDIIIQDQKLIWNSTVKDWINSTNAINEVGCIHTVQGYDLNYVGVIIGPEFTYENDSIKFYPELYRDKYGKHKSLSEDDMKTYVINIYKTLMTRGIKGTYVFACDNGLNQYLSRYINKFNMNQFFEAAEEEPTYNKS